MIWHPIQGESDHTHYIKETAMSPGSIKHTQPDEDFPPPPPPPLRLSHVHACMVKVSHKATSGATNYTVLFEQYSLTPKVSNDPTKAQQVDDYCN